MLGKNQKKIDKEWKNIISEIPETGQPINDTQQGPRDYFLVEPETKEEEKYYPLETGALTSKKAIVKIAWITIIFSILFFLTLASFFKNATPLLFGATLAILVTAIIILVINMPKSRESQDNGAVL